MFNVYVKYGIMHTMNLFALILKQQNVNMQCNFYMK